uniref:Uncharacterized protein n=1 Tax=Leersia perrieri TaxID=77586 RepID=A0A0D9XN98_9ORYZ
MRSPLAVVHTWPDLDIPKSWSPFKLNLVSLGSGRFCVVKMFTSDYYVDGSGDDIVDSDEIHSPFAMQLVYPRGKDDPGEVRMIKHKSMYHLFDTYNIQYVCTADNDGNTVVFDADHSTLIAFPNLSSPKRYNAIPLTIINNNGNRKSWEAVPEDSLYVLSRHPDGSIKDGCFEVLSYASSSQDFREVTPFWESLPAPPFVYTCADIDSYTVVDGSTIYISKETDFSKPHPDVTYAFDTVKREWRPAEYVPELKLWFGLSGSYPYSLCAFDLLSNGDAAKPPTVQHTWVDLDIPESWLLWNIHLINLACGRFCVVKMFRSLASDRGFGYSSSEEDDDTDPVYGNFAIFTGLHMHKFSGVHSLRRIPASRLFYPSTRAAEAAAEAMAKSSSSQEQHATDAAYMETMDKFGQFPAAMLTIQPTPSYRQNSRIFDLITPLGDDETKILAADSYGHTALLDTQSYSVVNFPRLICSKGHNAMAVSINRSSPNEPDNLYVLSLNPDYRDDDITDFEMLSYGGFNEWIPGWCPLPQPPLSHIDSYAIVGDSTIYVSSNKGGTHAFDTVTQQWRLHVGRNPLMWTMPFSGKAEYVLWFGLSGKYPYSLCACDLTNKQGGNLYTWLDLDIPKCWSPAYLRLISLGSGRFCVAKIFGTTRDDLFDSQFAVLTGLHMVCPRGRKHDDHQRDVPMMVKHKSICYTFSDYEIQWVV